MIVKSTHKFLAKMDNIDCAQNLFIKHILLVSEEVIYMLAFITMCFLSIFTVLGIISIIYEIKCYLSLKVPVTFKILLSEIEKEPEYYLRSLATLYPQANIEITPDVSNIQAEAVVAYLMCQMPQISVNTAYKKA